MPRKSATEKPNCHIHDKVEDWYVDDIRANVCVNDEALTEHEGKHYCLFHLPTKNKDIAKFEQILGARLKAVEDKIAEIEKLPEDKQTEANRGFRYDFRYVWFPSLVDLASYKFLASANFSLATFSADADFDSATFSADAFFSSATFSADAYFRSATFSAYASFSSATFSAGADFSSATFSADADFGSAAFSADAYFSSATFSADADFSSATFSADAGFSSATFSAYANFSSATFAADAYFRWAKFLETSQVFFRETKFCKTVDFNETVFAGYVAFEGKGHEKVFHDKKAVLEVKKELKEKFEKLRKELAKRGISFQIPDNFEENQEAVLNLQNARLEKPERISFHRVRLCPSWFVNVDSRKMVFTDVSWDNLDQVSWRMVFKKDSLDNLIRKFRNPNIIAEIESLEKRKVSEPSRLLEIACRQLAVNAEKNNRYEDASKFRYMAMETKRLEYAWHGRLWTLSWWYRLSSGYGENWSQAFLILLGILMLCGIFYDSPFAYFEMPEKKMEQENVIVINDLAKPKPPEYYKMNNFEGFIHSLYVAAIQRPEPKPAADSNLTKAFVILETIFAPLQATLLALAIRRKFMR